MRSIRRPTDDPRHVDEKRFNKARGSRIAYNSPDRFPVRVARSNRLAFPTRGDNLGYRGLPVKPIRCPTVSSHGGCLEAKISSAKRPVFSHETSEAASATPPWTGKRPVCAGASLWPGMRDVFPDTPLSSPGIRVETESVGQKNPHQNESAHKADAPIERPDVSHHTDTGGNEAAAHEKSNRNG